MGLVAAAAAMGTAASLVVLLGFDVVIAWSRASSSKSESSSRSENMSMSSKSPARVKPVVLLPLLCGAVVFLLGPACAPAEAVRLEVVDTVLVTFAFVRLGLAAVVLLSRAVRGRAFVTGAAPEEDAGDETRAGGLKAFFEACVAPGNEGIRCGGGIATSHVLEQCLIGNHDRHFATS